MTARDDYPFNMHDPWMTWRHMCDEIDRLRAEVSRYRTLTQEYNETCSKLTDRVAELHAELALAESRASRRLRTIKRWEAEHSPEILD